LFLGKVLEVAKSEPKGCVESFQRFVALRPDVAMAHYYYAVALAEGEAGRAGFCGARDAFAKGDCH